LNTINPKLIKMKKYLIIALAMTTLISCNSNADMSLFKENKEIAKKYLASYESPTDYENFVSMTDQKIEHQSPMYGSGMVGYKKVLDQGNFYMSNFSDVSFNYARWLPGVDEETLKADGSVRVYGTWKGVSNASGKSFSIDSYHYFVINEGKIVQSGDFMDATGMVMAVEADSQEEIE
jgi:ketosteroid isomerase-like protein